MFNSIAMYLTAARQAGLSSQSLKGYGWHLHKMAEWMAEHGCTAIHDVERDSLREWGAAIMDGWSLATCRQAVSACKALFKWCAAEGLIECDPADALRRPRVPEQEQRTLTLDEINALCEACDKCSVKGKRDIALIHLMIDTGLRASEICSIAVQDVHCKERWLQVRIKGGRVAVACFGKTTKKRLKAWMKVRPASDDVCTLFVAVGGCTPGRPLTCEGLRKILRDLGHTAGVCGVCPHAFRRSFACIATDQLGWNLREIQLAGRWEKMDMVRVYTRALEIKRVYKGKSPADKLG